LPDSAVEATGSLLDAIAAGRRRTIGLGRADDRWFTFCAGFGLDAEVVRRVERRRAKGARATPGLFVREGFAEFLTGKDRKDLPLTLHRPGADDERLGLALVCNTAPWTYLGQRPVLPCPQASFDTGLDVFGLRTLGTVRTLRYLRQILSDRPRLAGKALLPLHDVSAFTVTSSRPLPFQVDGDDLGERTSVAFAAVPRALQVLV